MKALQLRILTMSFLLIGLLGPAPKIFAQMEMSPVIVTAQPGYYISTYTAFPGNLIVESNLTFSSLSQDSRNLELDNLAIPIVLVRYGITKRLEIRASNAFNLISASVPGFSEKLSTLSPLNIGTQIQLIGPGQKLPQTALLLQIRIPKTGANVFPSNFLNPQALIITSFSLPAEIMGHVIAGFQMQEFSPQISFPYALAFDRSLGNGWAAYIEAFGNLNEDTDLAHNYDAGLVWAFQPNVQVDLSAGLGWAGDQSSWFTSAGFSFRIIPTRNMIKP